MTQRVAIIGGETHISEITQLHGDALAIVGVSMKEDQRTKMMPELDIPNYGSIDELLAETKPEVVAIANENHHKFGAIMKCLDVSCDVIVDKPLCIYLEEQKELEQYLVKNTDRRLLNLLTLRGEPIWRCLRDHLHMGEIGETAFIHVRMAVQLRRQTRPSWFLDVRQSGGLFLDLLIHGLDQVEWLTGTHITAVTANMGNLSEPSDKNLRDHASVFCELSNGGSAIVEGQRMLPDTKTSDYRVLTAGTIGYADMSMQQNSITLTNPQGAETIVSNFPDKQLIVRDWLNGGGLVSQEASLRANRLAILTTISADEHRRLEV